VIIALSTESKERVDRIMQNVIEAGGTESREAQDHGWMYGRGFQDIDGHLWEIIYMNEKALRDNDHQEQSNSI
jgi:predicted lactoylglutathione lyase